MKIAVLGRYENLYTRIVLTELQRQGVHVDCLVVERSRTARNGKARWVQKVNQLLSAVSSGPFESIPVWHPLYWKRVIQFIAYRYSRKRGQLLEEYIRTPFEELAAKTTLIKVADVNHAETYFALKNAEIDIGILGGVGIVSESILKTFQKYCLNAHPGPLPECRGSGAIEQALAQGLIPAGTVHIAESKVDAGCILTCEPIRIEEDDTMHSVQTKLAVHCGKMLARVIKRLVENHEFALKPNDGTTYRWRDCTVAVQRSAERKLVELRAQSRNAA
jgi:methionyl-tRNA formyltransferase